MAAVWGFWAGGRQGRCGRFGLSARDAVDYRGLALVSLEHLGHLPVTLAAGQDAVDEVRPIERTHEHGGIAEAQLRDDVVAYALRRGRGDGLGRKAVRVLGGGAFHVRFPFDRVITWRAGFGGCTLAIRVLADRGALFFFTLPDPPDPH